MGKKKNFPYILFFGSKQNPVAYINKKDILESSFLRQSLRIFPIFRHFLLCLTEILTGFRFRIRKLENGDLALLKTHRQMHVPVHGDLDRRMSQHLTECFDLYTRFHAACRKCMPLRYNNDKQKKPLFSRGLSVCRLLFNSFSKLKIDENYKEKRRLFY